MGKQRRKWGKIKRNCHPQPASGAPAAKCSMMRGITNPKWGYSHPPLRVQPQKTIKASRRAGLSGVESVGAALPISGSDGCAFFSSHSKNKKADRGKRGKIAKRCKKTKASGKSGHRNKLEKRRLRLLLPMQFTEESPGKCRRSARGKWWQWVGKGVMG